MSSGWIAVDLDGTLAQYDGWQGPEHIGPPVAPMVARIKRWRAAGVQVRIFTARVAVEDQLPVVVPALNAWMQEHLGEILPITNVKDYGMVELWDDRAVQVEANTGRRMDGQPEPEGPP